MSELSEESWFLNDEAMVNDGEGRCVCVLGDPFQGVTARDISIGTAIAALPQVLAAAKWTESVLPDCPSKRRLREALAKAGAL